MNPMVTPFILKQGEALLQSGVQDGVAGVDRGGSRRNRGSAAGPDEPSAFADILSGTLAKTSGRETFRREKNEAFFRVKAQVQGKATNSAGTGKTGSRAGLEGPVTSRTTAEAKTASRKMGAFVKAAKAAGPEGTPHEGSAEAPKAVGTEPGISRAGAPSLKGGKAFENAVRAATGLSERASASPTQAGKETAVGSRNTRPRTGAPSPKNGGTFENAARAAAGLSEQASASSTETGKEAANGSRKARLHRGSLKTAGREEKTARKLDASEVLLNRAQGLKSPKSSLAGVSEFTSLKGKPEKTVPHTKGSNKQEAGESRGQKKTETVRADTPRSETANIKDRAESAKAAVAEGRSPAQDGVNRPEDRFANILHARGESISDRVPENQGPLRPRVIIPQIVEGAGRLLRNGSGRMVMTLHPPQLGTIDMDIRVRDNRVSMLMLADNHEVKQVLESSLTQLRNALSEQGFQVDRVDVLVQDRSGNEFAGLLHEHGSSPEGRGRAAGGGGSPRGAETEPGDARRGVDAGESRLINVFA